MNQWINDKYLTMPSIDKLSILKLDLSENRDINKHLKKIINSMSQAFYSNTIFYPIILSDLNINSIRKTFSDFNLSFNKISDTKFSSDLNEMNTVVAFDLIIEKNIIRINFLAYDQDSTSKYISYILHALHTFCHMFKYNYDGLVIDVCLDSNERNLLNKRNFETKINNSTLQEIFLYLKQKSAAFNVSGVTNRSLNKIILTKKEEIIKLMYHELVHYIGLDREFVGKEIDFGWETTPSYLNVSEAYTEFMSIILNSAYETIHMCRLTNDNMYYLYEKILCAEINYSIYLSSSILKFFGYDHKNVVSFFRHDTNFSFGDKKSSPIYVWEYIILRANLLQNLNKVSEIVADSWKITSQNRNQIIKLMKDTDSFINKIQILMKTTQVLNNISYTVIDYNWGII